MSTDVELVVDAGALVGEGSLWNSAEQLLYWVDIMGCKLHIHDPSGGGDRVMDIGQPVGTVVVRASGGLMLANKDGFAAFDPASGELTLLDDPEADLPENRFNDGKCDPAGRFWAGTMAIDPVEGAGALYCMDTDLGVRKVLGGVSISNGIVWSLDGARMYFIDSLRYDVLAYDYDVETGDISNERIAFRVPREVGLPDGMAIDAEGMLWIAHFDGAKVCRWHPDSGEILQTIELPVSKTTSCAFGGPDLDTLYITSGSLGMTEEEKEREPHAGGLFAARPGCRGVEPFQFGG